MTSTVARLVERSPQLVAELGLAPCPWDIAVPPPDHPDDLVFIGGDLNASTLVTAYSRGLFPMPVGRRRLGWFSPLVRGVIPLDGLTVSRSLRRSRRRYEVRWNHRFGDVIRQCADPHRPSGWISKEIVSAYSELHRIGVAHSIEVHDEDGELVGGLYGIALRGLFAGESMFHRRRDASKVALVELVGALSWAGFSLLDVQWVTPHLATLGARELDRSTYLQRLNEALDTRPRRPDRA